MGGAENARNRNTELWLDLPVKDWLAYIVSW